MRPQHKRDADRKYYASYKGRLNRWRKGELDARDLKLRRLAREAGFSVRFLGVDTVELVLPVFTGNPRQAIDILSD